MEYIFFIILFLIPQLFVILNFFYYIFNGRVKTNRTLFYFVEFWIIFALPVFFLANWDLNNINDCCTTSAVFSPEHRIGIYILIVLAIGSYFASSVREEVYPPLAEVAINSFLILGLIINVLIIIHMWGVPDFGSVLAATGNIPILLLILIRLHQNNLMIKEHIQANNFTIKNTIGKFCLNILALNPNLKYPVLSILLVPVLIILSLILILFGQEPDSMIKAFTETYKHGFSKLDYECANVRCGGHFLCSVGANGHEVIVKPKRYGERNGNLIICNRQLLVSNAFEEVIQERYPILHKFIRDRYNKIGDGIHKHYHIFSNKFISDFVYILMKPLEFIFLIFLYTFDSMPENRIASQYLSLADKKKIAAYHQTALH